MAYFFSAVLTTSSKHRAERSLRDAWAWSSGTDGYESDDYVKTPLEGHHFDSEVAVVVDVQVAIMEGCEFVISGSSAIIRKQAIPKIRIFKIRRATMSTVIWRCGETMAPPLKLVEAPSSSARETMKRTLEEAPSATMKEQDASPAPNVPKRERGESLAGDGGAEHSVPDTSSGTTQWTPHYISSYAQGCDDIDQQLGTKTLECRLCGAKHSVRMNYCYACMSLFGTLRANKECFKRLTAEVSQRFGFN